MRLFIAVDLNELKAYFQELQSKLSRLHNVKLIFTKVYHITLKFLGEVQPPKVDIIKDKLKTIKFNEINAKTDNIGFFPDRKWPRVIWLGISPEDKIIELQKEIDLILKGMFKLEKNFKPHITLARIKHYEDKAFIEEIEKINLEPKAISFNKFHLYKSTLSREGAIHEVMESYELHA